MRRAYQAYQSTIRALETNGGEISWSFAHADAMEAGREAERFLCDRLQPYLDKTHWTDADFADLMRLELQYQDLSRHSRRLMDALLLRPAPDLAALVWKLEYLSGPARDGYRVPLPATVFTILAEDARRLMGGMFNHLGGGRDE